MQTFVLTMGSTGENESTAAPSTSKLMRRVLLLISSDAIITNSLLYMYTFYILYAVISSYRHYAKKNRPCCLHQR